MNLIQKQAQEFLEYNLNTGDLYKNFISKVRNQLFEYRKTPHKIEFVNHLIKTIKIEYETHLNVCHDLKNCDYNKFYENVLFFLQEEIEDLELQLTPIDFNKEERTSINESLQKILDNLNTLKLGQELTYNDLFEEFEELKDLYFLNKKHWTEIFIGKLSEMVVGGVINETVSKQIIDLIKKNYINLINS
jgi:predicted DNA-binding protein (MmcQ/YjbR family)